MGQVEVTGVPWAPEGRRVPISALVANILCERHNSALSPLDSAARDALLNIRQAVQHATRPGGSTKSFFSLSSGEALELWGIKTLAGLYFAKISSTDGKRAFEHQPLDMSVIEAGLSGSPVPDRFGLYVEPTPRDVDGRVGMAPLSDPASRALCGLRFSYWGLCFDVLTDLRGAGQEFLRHQTFYRPTLLDWNGPSRTARCVLSWGDNLRTWRRVAFDVEASPAQGILA